MKTLLLQPLLFIVFLVMCVLFIFASCAPENGTYLSDEAQRILEDHTDQIVVANATGKNVVLLNSSFNFVRDLIILPKASADAPWGLALKSPTEILVSIEGVDRVMSASLDVGSPSATDVIVNTNLAGTPMRGLAVLTSGDILAAEGNTVERFTSTGDRVTTSGWPKTLQTNTTQLFPLSNGGFIACSIGTNVVRAYDSSGTQTATVASGIVGTTTVAGCAAGPIGQVVAAYYGTTDTIRLYSSSTLATTVWSFSDLTLLANPQAVGILSNGNVIAIDGTSNVAVELDGSTGALVRTFSSSAINGAVSLLVIP